MDQLSLSQSVRRALIGTGALLGAMPLFAADPGSQGNAQDDDELAEVVITGSRVRGAAPVGAAVITLDRDALESAGQATIDRILKDIPQNFDLGVSENSRAQSGGSGNIVYGNTVNLRGVGPYATLVLLDGPASPTTRAAPILPSCPRWAWSASRRWLMALPPSTVPTPLPAWST
jgi:outer membrane receptor for ferrienterochelin and colicin